MELVPAFFEINKELTIRNINLFIQYFFRLLGAKHGNPAASTFSSRPWKKNTNVAGTPEPYDFI